MEHGVSTEIDGSKLRAMTRKHLASPSLRVQGDETEFKQTEAASPLRTPRGSFDAKERKHLRFERMRDRGDSLPRGACVALFGVKRSTRTSSDEATSFLEKISEEIRKRKLETRLWRRDRTNGPGTEEACYGCSAALIVVEWDETEERDVQEGFQHVLNAALSVGVPRLVCLVLDRHGPQKAKQKGGKREKDPADTFARDVEQKLQSLEGAHEGVLWTIVRARLASHWAHLFHWFARPPRLHVAEGTSFGEDGKSACITEVNLAKLIAQLVERVHPDQQMHVLEVCNRS